MDAMAFVHTCHSIRYARVHRMIPTIGLHFDCSKRIQKEIIPIFSRESPFSVADDPDFGSNCEISGNFEELFFGHLYLERPFSFGCCDAE